MSLYRNAVWFGTQSDMRWVPAPLPNYAPAQVRWSAVDQFLNGGAAVRQSVTSHKELSLTWPVQSMESLAPLISYLQQPGPFFYLDPLNAASNCLPAYWASPGVIQDGPKLVSSATATYVPTSGGSELGYPGTSAVVNLASKSATKIQIPVPEGYTLYVGLHGSGPGISVGGIDAPAIPVTSSQRTNLEYATPGVATIELLAGTHSISGIIAQVLPPGQVPDAGGFLPGLGHSQLVLNGSPTTPSYSVGLPNAQMGLAADFIEVGAWQE